MANKLTKKEQKYVVEKSNALNEMLARDWTLQETRFFAIYLAKINARNPDTRFVRLSLEDFGRIMDLTDVRAKDIKPVCERLLQKIVVSIYPNGGFGAFQFFRWCEVNQTDNGQWYIEMDANDRALPLIFEYKRDYFKYELWNIVHLTSVNQSRMYEFLKQYENLGEKIVTVEYLRSFLGIESKEYPRWESFRVWVLNACRKALAEKTDIKFTYEVYGRRGKGGKILSLRFIIEKNENYVSQLRLHEFVDLTETETDDDAIAEKEYQERKEWGGVIPGDRPPGVDDDTAEIIKSLGHCVNFEFTWEQMNGLLKTLELVGLYSILVNVNDGSRVMSWLSNLYEDMCRQCDAKRNTSDPIKHRFKYFQKIIQNQGKSAFDVLVY